jgi:hypothetical protein
MHKVIASLLARKRQELEHELSIIESMLIECKQSHVNPAKDYWHRKVRLENEIKTLEHALEKLND